MYFTKPKNNVKIDKIRKRGGMIVLLDVLIILLIVVIIALAILYYFNRKNMGKMVQAQDFIEQNKIATQIFVIDKKI